MRGLASLLVLAAAAGALLLHGGAAPAAPPPLVFAEGEGLAEARAAGFADLHVAAGGREAALHVAGVPGASVSLGDVLEVRNPGAQDQDVRLRRSTPLDPAVLAFRVEVRDEAGLTVARWDAAASAAAPDAAPDIVSDAALDVVPTPRPTAWRSGCPPAPPTRSRSRWSWRTGRHPAACARSSSAWRPSEAQGAGRTRTGVARLVLDGCCARCAGRLLRAPRAARGLRA